MGNIAIVIDVKEIIWSNDYMVCICDAYKSVGWYNLSNMEWSFTKQMNKSNPLYDKQFAKMVDDALNPQELEMDRIVKVAEAVKAISNMCRKSVGA